MRLISCFLSLFEILILIKFGDITAPHLPLLAHLLLPLDLVLIDHDNLLPFFEKCAQSWQKKLVVLDLKSQSPLPNVRFTVLTYSSVRQVVHQITRRPFVENYCIRNQEMEVFGYIGAEEAIEYQVQSIVSLQTKLEIFFLEISIMETSLVGHD